MNRVIAALGLVASSALGAQQNVPLRYLAPELRIEGHDLSKKLLWPIGLMGVDGDGRILIWPNNSNAGLNAFDANGKALPFHIQTGFRGDNVIVFPQTIGRFGKDVWITDPFNNQVVFVAPDAKVTGGIPHPTWIHPKWAERRKFPIFGKMNVVAVYPDTQLLVRPTSPRTLLDTPEFDRKIDHLLRIKPDGQIQREIARFAEDTWRVTLRGENSASGHVIPVPFGMRTFTSAGTDGSRVAVLVPNTTAAEHGSYRLTSIDGKGDTVFSRRYPMADVAVSQPRVDSALKLVHAYGDKSAEQIKALLKQKIPAYRSFLTQVIAGFDQSTWVFTRSTVDSSQAREALIIDPRGEPLARVEIPVGFNPLHADRDHLWGTDKLKPAVIRFKVQATPAPVTAAPPPRTVKAAATKG